MHSILFYIGPIPIRAYGLMLWVALVVGLIRTIRAAGRKGMNPTHVIDICLYGVLAGVVTAHLTSILLDFSYYRQSPSEILGLWSGMFSEEGGLRGLSFHGGLIGAMAVAFIYTRRKGISFLDIADICAPALALGYAVTRIGCFLNGCCYGMPTSLPWAVRFHLDTVSGATTPPSHPAQIYAALANLLIFFLLVAVEKRRRFMGQVFLSYLALYSAYRFLVEFVRKGVTADVAFAWVTEAQLASLVLLAITLPLLVRGLRELPSKQRPVRSRKVNNPKSKPKNRKGG